MTLSGVGHGVEFVDLAPAQIRRQELRKPRIDRRAVPSPTAIGVLLNDNRPCAAAVEGVHRRDSQLTQPLNELFAIVPAVVRPAPPGRLQVKQQLANLVLADLADLCTSKQADHPQSGRAGQGKRGQPVLDRGKLLAAIIVEPACHLNSDDLPIALGRLEIVPPAWFAWCDSVQSDAEDLLEALARKNFVLVQGLFPGRHTQSVPVR
jgi:hypothetical protein